MPRTFMVVTALLFLLGCRAPTPSLDIFAPYGSPTVPPPPTGTIGASGQYYAPGTAKQSGSAATNASESSSNRTSMQLQSGTPASSFLGAQRQASTSPKTGQVATTAFQEGATSRDPGAAQANANVPLRRADPAQASGRSELKLHGMPVNDATHLAEPQPFQPSANPTNLADLPPAQSYQTPSFMRILNPRPTASLTPAPAAAPAAAASTGGWQTR